MFSFICFTALLNFFAVWNQDTRQKDFVQITAPETTVAKGKRIMIPVEVKVKEGYHIQANKVNDESLIPAKLEITPIPQLIVELPVFPDHKLFRLESTEDDLNVFDGKFEIKVPIKTASGTAAGRYILKAAFRYQACDHKSCFFPRTINIELPVVVK